jgi:hypothetical protein
MLFSKIDKFLKNLDQVLKMKQIVKRTCSKYKMTTLQDPNSQHLFLSIH